jgi:hypothetical protein
VSQSLLLPHKTPQNKPNTTTSKPKTKTKTKEYEVPDGDEAACARELPTPLELAALDPPLPWFMGDQRILNPDIRVGSPLEAVVGGNADLVVTLVTTFRYSR